MEEVQDRIREQLVEMDAINGDFKTTDMVIVLGANDVVNPAALDEPDSPVYGMPILNVHEARTVIVVKLLVDTEATDRPFGQIAIGILLVQDLFVVILLTLLSGIGGGEEGFELSTLGWGLVRASNTSAALLFRFEAVTEQALQRIQSEFKALIQRADNSIELNI